MSKKDIGIDLGTANTLIYQKTKGIVLDEPSVVAVDSADGHIIAVGKEAKEMLGRTPAGIKAVRPITDGVIADFEAAGAMLAFFIKKVLTSSGSKPRAVIGVPTGITAVERKAAIEVAGRAGIRDVALVDEPMAAAIGAGLAIDAPSGIMIVDIGGGTSEVAVISLGGIVARKTVRTGGDTLDRAIIGHIRKKYGICAGFQSAEDIKLKIGTVMKNSTAYRHQVNGRNTGTGLPCSTFVTGDDIRAALIGEIHSIIDAIKAVLEDTPPELSGDILNSGIVLTGGGAFINGIDRLICNITGMPVRVAENPLECVALGLGVLIDDKASNKKIFKTK